MLPKQCEYFRLPIPQYFRKWINVKCLFSNVTHVRARGMPGMLEHLRLPLKGRHHSGIDDCRNIAKIITALAQKNPKIHPHMTLPPFEF